MAKPKTEQPERTVTVTKRNGQTVSVQTSMTAQEALDALGGEEFAKRENDFKAKAAFELYKTVKGFRANDTMVAWGYVLAVESKSGKRTSSAGVTVQLPEIILSMVQERKPLRIDLPSGGCVKISKSGPMSKNHGGYVLNNDQAFRTPGAKFYGYATKDGVWTITRDVTDEVQQAIENI